MARQAGFSKAMHHENGFGLMGMLVAKVSAALFPPIGARRKCGAFVSGVLTTGFYAVPGGIGLVRNGCQHSRPAVAID